MTAPIGDAPRVTGPLPSLTPAASPAQPATESTGATVMGAITALEAALQKAIDKLEDSIAAHQVDKYKVMPPAEGDGDDLAETGQVVMMWHPPGSGDAITAANQDAVDRQRDLNEQASRSKVVLGGDGSLVRVTGV